MTLAARLQHWWIVLVAYWRQSEPEPTTAPEPDPTPTLTLPEPVEPESPADVPPYPGWQKTPDGSWADPDVKFIHLEDLLDQIPLCQKLLKALKRHDPSAYEYHSRLGARLLSDTSVALWGRLHDDTKATLPTSGLIYHHEHLSANEDEDHVPLMLYFDKQAVNLWTNYGTTYKVAVVWWVRFHRNSNVELKKPFAVGGRYTVVVHDDGRVLAVPEPTVVDQRVQHHRPQERKRGVVTHLAHYKMALPGFLHRRYEERRAHLDEPIEIWAGGIAAWAINAATAGAHAEQFMVLAERNGVAARFDVALAKPKAFFRDRGCALAVDGRRKRIIHWVGEHERTLADGREVRVRGHFRGLTEFEWHGSKVTVLMPKNDLDTRLFNIGVHELSEDEPIPPNFEQSAEAADRLKEWMIKYGDKKHAK